MSSSKREQLLDAAIELFYRHGCHTIGIDKVLAEAGVAKMTLYKHFKSKEELVLAAAERFHDRAKREFEAAIASKDYTPRQRLIAMFDVLANWLRESDYRGCPSINLAVEYPQIDHPIHQAAANHKRQRIVYMRELAAAAGAREPQQLAEQLVLLLEGATVMAQLNGNLDLVERARATAEQLIEAALPENATLTDKSV